MPRSILCAVGEPDAWNEVAVAARLSGTLGLGLVLAHVADGPASADAEGTESLSTVQARQGAGRLVDRAAAEHGVTGLARRRSDVGQPAPRLAQIAAEEDAAVIVVGARKAGLFRSSLKSPLAEELTPLAPCSVVLAPGERATQETGEVRTRRSAG
jgi:nucleotide-binding universal stress UspA family protein